MEKMYMLYTINIDANSLSDLTNLFSFERCNNDEKMKTLKIIKEYKRFSVPSKTREVRKKMLLYTTGSVKSLLKKLVIVHLSKMEHFEAFLYGKINYVRNFF
jgi:hypothetical protein